LVKPDPLAAIAAAGALGVSELQAAASAEPRAYMKDIALSLAPAWRLKRLAQAKGFDHVHVHSCASSALAAMLGNRAEEMTALYSSAPALWPIRKPAP